MYITCRVSYRIFGWKGGEVNETRHPSSPAARVDKILGWGDPSSPPPPYETLVHIGPSTYIQGRVETNRNQAADGTLAQSHESPYPSTGWSSWQALIGGIYGNKVHSHLHPRHNTVPYALHLRSGFLSTFHGSVYTG